MLASVDSWLAGWLILSCCPTGLIVNVSFIFKTSEAIDIHIYTAVV